MENDRWKKQEPLKLPHHQWWKDEKGLGGEEESVTLFERMEEEREDGLNLDGGRNDPGMKEGGERIR